jgi:inorganic pyrophosphatase
MQDTRKNVFTNELELRFYSQFPLFNYGFIPQTW